MNGRTRKGCVYCQVSSSFPASNKAVLTIIQISFYLLGDPINTIWHMLNKLAACQRRAEYWREEYRITFKTLLGDQPDRTWKALALIEDAYDELDERQERGCGASCMYTLTIPQLGKQVFFLRKITCVEMGSQLALIPKRTCSDRWSIKQRAHLPPIVQRNSSPKWLLKVSSLTPLL